MADADFDFDNYMKDVEFGQRWEDGSRGMVVVERDSRMVIITSIEEEEDPKYLYAHVREIDDLIQALAAARDTILKRGEE